MRDFQRAKVYDAEGLVWRTFDHADSSGVRTVELYGSQLTLPVERRFGSVAAVADYSQGVLGLNWVRRQWSRAATPVQVRARAGADKAHYEFVGAVLAVPTERGARSWALREFVILHELAHHLQPFEQQEAAHGGEFCGRYVDLVEGVIGAEAALLLRSAMLASGVKLR